MKVISERVVFIAFYIYCFLLHSLVRYLCWWTISPWWYHSPSSQCFGIDIAY